MLVRRWRDRKRTGSRPCAVGALRGRRQGWWISSVRLVSVEWLLPPGAQKKPRSTGAKSARIVCGFSWLGISFLCVVFLDYTWKFDARKRFYQGGADFTCVALAAERWGCLFYWRGSRCEVCWICCCMSAKRVATRCPVICWPFVKRLPELTPEPLFHFDRRGTVASNDTPASHLSATFNVSRVRVSCFCRNGSASDHNTIAEGGVV